MNIVFLDTLPGCPGDVALATIEAQGTLLCHEDSPPGTLAARLAAAHVAITNKCRITEAVMAAAPGLKLICEFATGYDNIDVAAAARRSITVCNVPAYSTASTAQTAVALLLELTQQAGDHSRGVQAGEWCAAPRFCYWKHPLVELAGKRMVIVGYGNIGRRVAAVAEALGMAVTVARIPGRPARPCDRPCLDLDEVLPVADVLSLHCPLSDLTRGLLNRERLARMKASALVVNCARGPVVVEADVAAALREGRIGGFAADVLSREPPPPDNPLLGAPRCILTPHIGWATREARQRLVDITADNIRQFVAGHPVNRVAG